MTRVYNREKIEIHCETKNVLVHVIIMTCFSIFFMKFFEYAFQNPEIQEQIRQNIMIVPIGQLLAYEGYFSYIILKIIQKWRENIRLERTWLNAFNAGVKLFHEYATWVIDLFAITIITFQFFIFYLPPEKLEEAIEASRISDLMFVSVFPGLIIITHLIIREIRLKRRN